MLKKVSKWGAMLRKGYEKDVEKAEQSTNPQPNEKIVENSDSSTKPKVTEEVIEKCGSPATPEITEQYDEDCTKIETIIKKDLAKSPDRLRKTEGSSCIFRIPQSLTKIHPKGYEPEILSIGPYHHNKNHLLMIQEHKPRFLALFIAEAANADVNISFLVKKILEIENDIRNSYSENLVGVDKHKLVNMMLLDGCFILMLFFFATRKVDAKEKCPHDPILTTPWIFTTIRSDLLLLENQVPLILLETLFKATRMSSPDSSSLQDLAFKFFDLSMVKKGDFWKQYNKLEAKHLLDLIRKTFIPILSTDGSSNNSTKTTSSCQLFSRLILSAKRLRLQGIKFKASHDHSSSKVCPKKMIDYLFNESHAFVSRSSHEKTILEIQLKGNELQIPPIVFDEFISSVLLNCVAFEQLATKCSNNITSYVVFMGCLMNDEADATYLSEKGIIENYFGNGSDVSEFFKTISNGVAFDLSNSYLKEVFEGINKYTSKRWNVEYARFKHIHFDSPWACMSSSAVLVILLLTIFQATFAGLSYLRPPEQPSNKGT